jgi:leader peptidase (prepilin peptidase)/N-methyltransferase
VIVQHASRGVWLNLIFVAALVAITQIDLEHRIIPNKIVAAVAVAAIVLTAALQPHLLTQRLIAGAIAGGVFGVIAFAYPAGMGMGDAKLAAVMGLVLGRAVAPALMIALIAGTIVGVGVIARRGVSAGRKSSVPFGPFLAFGSIVALFAGEAIVNAYLHGAGL